jgi:hypothetical protein
MHMKLQVLLYRVCLIASLSIAIFTGHVVAAESRNVRSERASLSGSWSGGGALRYADGRRAAARCRANFSPSGTHVTLSARWATPSGTIEQSASLRQVGPNAYAGSFFNPRFNVSGSIHITVHGNTQSVSLRSATGSASLTLRH